MDQVTVRYPDGTTSTVASEMSLARIVSSVATDRNRRVVAAMVNNEALDLSRRIRINAQVDAVFLDSDPGVRIYRHSLCFLLAHAWCDVFPDHRLIVGHSLGQGYYYQVDGPDPTEEGLRLVDARMRELVDEDLPIRRRLISYHDALDYFRGRGMLETVALLDHRNDSRVAVHECRGFMELSHGPLVPSTGLLQAFELTPLTPGFVLRYPSRETPDVVGEYHHSPVLFSIYQEYKEWGRILGVTSVGRLNQKTVDESAIEFIRVNEALHERKITQIAETVCDRIESVRVVLIAGPSSSGKTTFTKKLALHLQALGLEPQIVSVDNYFLSRDRTPLDEDGKHDFESIHAVDIPALNDDLLRLFAGEEIDLPTFDFKTGERRYAGRKARLGPRGVLLMEGIHCLNDELTERIDPARKFKVYISALTQLNLDDHNRISTTDNRLIRRLVRDHQFRGHSAASTLSMWPSVRRGERRNIFPYQDTADAAFNSALDYELGVLKKHAEPLLSRVKPAEPVYNEAVRLLLFLRNFTNIPDKLVPDFSILREFIGDSGFHY